MRRLSQLLLVVLLVSGSWLAVDGLYIEAKAWLAQVLLQSAWREAEEGGERVRPWPWADTWPLARMEVERLKVDQVVLAGASGRTLAFGPGHIEGTAMPGTRGNSVISGHRDTHFRFLQHLQPGDQIGITRPDGSHIRYAVMQLSVQSEEDTWLLRPTPSRLTLITCYPFDALIPGGAERFVVIAEPVLI